MHAMRIPSTGLTTSQENQFLLEEKIAEIPEVKYVFSKTGTAELAADPDGAERHRQLRHPRKKPELWRSTAELAAAAEEAEGLMPTDPHGDEEGEGEEAGATSPSRRTRWSAWCVRRSPRCRATTTSSTQPIEMRFNGLHQRREERRGDQGLR